MVELFRAGGGERTRRPAAVPVPIGTFRDVTSRAPTPHRPVVGVGPRLGDERGFVHKRIFRGIKGAVGGILGGPGGVIGGAVGGFLTPSVTRLPALPAGCPPGFSMTTQGCLPTQTTEGRRLRGEPVVPGGRRFDPLGVIKARASELFPGAPQELEPRGEAMVTGRSFGPGGFEPEFFATTTRRCPRGAVLAVDGLCYNRRDLRNTERMWPRGRRPLLTGGEMRCISVASSAAKKLQRKQKQLQQLGLLKSPSRARRALPAGHVAQVKHG